MCRNRLRLREICGHKAMIHFRFFVHTRKTLCWSRKIRLSCVMNFLRVSTWIEREHACCPLPSPPLPGLFVRQLPLSTRWVPALSSTTCSRLYWWPSSSFSSVPCWRWVRFMDMACVTVLPYLLYVFYCIFYFYIILHNILFYCILFYYFYIILHSFFIITIIFYIT